MSLSLSLCIRPFRPAVRRCNNVDERRIESIEPDTTEEEMKKSTRKRESRAKGRL